MYKDVSDDSIDIDYSESRAQRSIAEGGLIALVALCVFLFIILISFDANDPGWSRAVSDETVQNLGGRVGAYVSDIIFALIGFMGYLLPMIVAVKAWRKLKWIRRVNKPKGDSLVAALGFVVVCIFGSTVAALHLSHIDTAMHQAQGGIIGQTFAQWLIAQFNPLGASLIAVPAFLVGLTMFTGISWVVTVEKLGELTLNLIEKLQQLQLRRQKARQESAEIAQRTSQRSEALKAHKAVEKTREPIKINVPKPSKKSEPSERAVKAKQETLFSSHDTPLPNLSVLDDKDDNTGRGFSAESLEAMSRLLELKLKEFNVVAEVVSVQPGPVVTRFEIQPAPGVKAAKITNLSKDLARSMSVQSVRVVEVIPGKSVMGIELPNEDRQMVRVREVLESTAFDQQKSPLTIALGHDIAGQPVMADIAKMPHLLVAGTTGAGKSVGVNVLLTSILFKSTPEEVRFILVDPKMLELSIYEGIPHLLTPVITDMNDAANGLRWCVGEMERRYKLMAALGVRNLAGFNRKVKEAAESGQPIIDPLWKADTDFTDDQPQAPELETLPAIVVVIDEFADMMMIVGKKVEQLIARIAQKARAAGIHLVLATQRPSVDVITGLIKANVPTRMAFQVSSRIDSRTILDQGGAEQLLGHGDMLFLPAGTSIPTRVHGAFIDDHEVHAVVEEWKQRGEPNYITNVIEENSSIAVPGYDSEGSEGGGGSAEEVDKLYDEAVDFVLRSRKASISSVQRRLRIGYNRAARLIEAMEEAGVISAMTGAGQREVLAPPPQD